MILQELLFPNFDTCATHDMYFKAPGAHFMEATPFVPEKADFIRFDQKISKQAYYDPDERAVHMAAWQYLGFDTYFNCFSIGKWLKYTRLDNLKLQLELKGGFHVQLMHMYYMNTVPFENIFQERVCRAGERTLFEFDIPLDAWDQGVIAFKLDSLEGADNVYYGGRYMTEVDEESLNPVDIAIDICTFRREKFVEKNIRLLNREIIKNPHSPMYGHLDVFISDNGKTLDIDRLQSDRVHIFPNKNVGGAGGFSRGMIEIIDAAGHRHISHALLMDDDVIIHADAILRTYRLLQFLKSEYSGKTVAGAMLRLDKRFEQHECGAWWDGNVVHGCKSKLDLTILESILDNEKEDAPTYNAWWYSCIPMTKVSNGNLPLPIFIRYDDVEFGLRTGGDIISMNGICLWHEPFEYKYSSSMEYYHMRNSLIINVFHRPGYDGKAAAGHMKYMIKSNLGRYRYKNCELVLRAVEDFLKGPEFLLNTDGEALHKEIMAAADKFLPLKECSVQFDEETYDDTFEKERIRWKLVRYITLNKHLWPRRGTSVVDASLNGVKDFAGKRSVLNYDVSGNRGFITEYDRAQALDILKRSRQLARRLKAEHANVCKAYREAQPTLTSRDFWNRYLGL